MGIQLRVFERTCNDECVSKLRVEFAHGCRSNPRVFRDCMLQVFLGQLYRRAKLLNPGFQRAVLDVIHAGSGDHGLFERSVWEIYEAERVPL